MDNATDPCHDGDEEAPRDVFIMTTTTTTTTTTGEMDPAENQPTSTSQPAKDILTERKKRMRRERRKMTKKKTLVDHSPNMMSELPFALASSTAWNELGFAKPESSQRKRKRKLGDGGTGRVDSEEEEEEKKTKKKKKKQQQHKESQRPNYFVSIPITNAQISAAVVEVQEAVLQQEPRLAKAMIPAPSLHITLFVTHLANQEQVGLATTALDKAMPSLAELLVGRDLVLPFSGVGHFRKEVVFVGLGPGQHRDTLEKLAEVLRRCFQEQGLLQADCRGFEPHLTIMKLSKAPKLRSQGLKRVNPDFYSSYSDRFFGDQRVERLDLCSMLKKKQPDGYYHTETSLQLDLVRSPLQTSKRTSGRQRREPSDAELQRVSKRLVEDAVSRALHQYKQETLQNGGGPNAAGGPAPPAAGGPAPSSSSAAAATQPPGNTKESTTAGDNRK